MNVYSEYIAAISSSLTVIVSVIAILKWAFPSSAKVKEQQLNKVFLPLYKILINNSHEHQAKWSPEKYELIKSIIVSNPLLVTQDLAYFYQKLLQTQNNEMLRGRYVSIFTKHVNYKYYSLKRSLGYPSVSVWKFLKMKFDEIQEYRPSLLTFLFSFIAVIVMYIRHYQHFTGYLAISNLEYLIYWGVLIVIAKSLFKRR